MSNLLEFAKSELAILRGPSPKPSKSQDWIEENVLKIVEAFASGGHSGSSAAYTLAIIKKVLAFEPVTPLTGEDNEWTALGYDDDIAFQNKRCPHVFKRADGTAFDTQAIVFEDPDGSRCTNFDSRRDITFPYVPTSEIVKRGATAEVAEPGQVAFEARWPAPRETEWDELSDEQRTVWARVEAAVRAASDPEAANG